MLFDSSAWYVPKQVSAHGWVNLSGSCKHDRKPVPGVRVCSLTAMVCGDDGREIYSGPPVFSGDGSCNDDRHGNPIRVVDTVEGKCPYAGALSTKP